MSDNIQIIKNKRGRKPKNKNYEVQIDNSPANSQEEPIIVHLPISLEDVVNIPNNNNNLFDDNIFIKSESEIINKQNVIIHEEPSINEINKKIIETEKMFIFGKNINKISVHNIKFKQGNKCYWCKNSFNTQPIELPEDYYNDTFFCYGYFCSWNCAKAFNIDLNDTSTWKRESLLNLMYYKTYGTYKEIIPAPSWLLLIDFGGILDIDSFRNSFVTNNKDYLLLRPPMITRQLQIEESYKKSSSNNKSDTIHDNELILKRSKPVENAKLNLEKTMGLKKIITSKK